jgi:16S rRNA (adenine1518-N6/adenine1519-N6)-dimethyltransferase
MSPELPPLRDVIGRFGLDARKKFGQHFLLDLNLTARIARAAGDLSACTVIEVGPGPGGLTRALLDGGAKQVIAVERDPRCVEAIEDLTSHYDGRLKIIDADALELDLAGLCDGPKKIVANLPYNVATPLLISWLKKINQFESLTLMFQKEVADRLTASPGNKTYGRLSVLVQWLCHANHDFNIGRTAFTPPPKVESTVVTLTPRSEPVAAADWQNFEKVTAAAFGQRRKMLRASLKSLNVDLESLGIDPTARAETLRVDQFCAIARAIK